MDDPYLSPYLATRDRVIGLVRGADDDLLGAVVPACPAWTARDLLGHLAGLAVDWVDGRLDDYGSDAWAAAQIHGFDGATPDEVVAAWRAASDAFPGLGPAPQGGTPAMWAFGDAVVHEADLRAVLAPGTRLPADASALGTKAAVARWRSALGAAGVGPLDLVTEVRTWRIGVPEGDADRVETTAHDVFRALFGRRSRAQVAAWDWSTDPGPYLSVGLPFPFRWSETDLTD